MGSTLTIVDFFTQDRKTLLDSTLNEWAEFCDQVSLGELYTGTVCFVCEFGVYVDFGLKFPCLLESPNLSARKRPMAGENVPRIGERIRFQAIQIVDGRRIIRGIEMDEPDQ